jgi:protein-L-isoaspartate(D-aspartate) O-methyltransferase
MLDYAKARRMMVDSQLRTFDVNDLAVLAAFDEVPRERFVPPGRESLAYMDQDLPTSDGANGGERRFMLSPMVLARMIQALDLKPGDKVLDVAPGLGYSSAVLARLGCSVVALEAGEDLAAPLRRRLVGAGVEGVLVVAGPLQHGYPDAAPYDAVLVNGAVETRPEALLRQLTDRGRLASVEGRGRSARAILTVRSGDAYGSRPLFDAAAPPLAAFRAEPGFVF